MQTFSSTLSIVPAAGAGLPYDDVTRLLDNTRALAAGSGFLGSTSDTGSQNNFNIGALSTYDVRIAYWTGSSDLTLTGQQAGAAGRQVLWINKSSAKLIRFSHESGSSTAANRFTNPSSLSQVAIGPHGIALTTYNGSSRWEVSVLVQGIPIEVAPAQITANQNDYAPTDLVIADTLAINSDAARDITGIAAAAFAGRRLTLPNTGNFAITLKHASGSSSAANQFILPGGADLVLDANDVVELLYRGSRWWTFGYRNGTSGA